MVKALSRTASEEDAVVAEHVADECVHLGLLEEASVRAALLLKTPKLRWAADLFGEEVGDVDGTILTTQHAVGDAFAGDGLALVRGAVLLVVEFGAGLAVLEVAHEGLSLVDPD